MTDTQAAVKAATTPATFNFAEAILDRSYPEFEVPVFLNENKVTELLVIAREEEALTEKIAKMKAGGPKTAQTARLTELESKHEALQVELDEGKYIVTVRGIANERHKEIEDAVYEKFPREYDEEVSEVTGATVKTEKENEVRDEEFAMMIRQAHIVSIKAPNGAVDSDFGDLEKVRVVYTRLPLVARGHIDTAISNCTLTVDYYREIVDEVF